MGWGRFIGSLARRMKRYASIRKPCDLIELFERPTSTLVGAGDAGEAQKQLAEAVHLNTNYPAALTALGKAFVVENKFDQAESAFRQTVELNPTNAEARVTLANALMLRGQTNAAMAEL